jgi:hypothetical protein
MILMSQDPAAGRSQDDVTLGELRPEFPDLHINADFCGPYRAWVARGRSGHPWLVLSADSERFRVALRYRSLVLPPGPGGSTNDLLLPWGE